MFKTEEILKATEGRLIHGDLHQSGFSGVSTDTRTIQPGDLFVALKGERYDAHTFVNEALSRGAAGAVISILEHRIPETPAQEELRRGKIIIGVNDTLSALQGLAQFHRNRFNLPLTAITGSNGKTTTKEMCAEILSHKFNVLRSKDNYNNHIGVPLSLLKLSPKHNMAILEMGISRRGELARLAQVARPQVGLITNISASHLETLGTVQAVAEAKGELLEALPGDEGIAILNQDDPSFDDLKQKAHCRTVTFGCQPEAQVLAQDISVHDHSVTIFKLVVRQEVIELGARFGLNKDSTSELSIRLPLLGTHNVMNALAASAVGVIFGCPLEQIKSALETFQPILMRSQLLNWQGISIINDAYNANPASMHAALDVLGQFYTKGQRIAVLGDMLELGTADHQAHREVGQLMAEISSGRLIVVGPSAKLIADSAVVNGMHPGAVSICENTEEAAETLRKSVCRGDVVLVKGSRGMHLERVVDAFRKFTLES